MRKGRSPLFAMGILAFLVALIAVVSAGCGSGAATTADEGTSPSSAAPSTASTVEEAGFSGVTLDGTEVSLSQYRGKPLVLVFMASW